MRKRLLCPEVPATDSPVLLPESEAKHALRVLRLGSGDIIEVLDGKGRHCLARLLIRVSGVHLEYVEDLVSNSVLNQQLVPLTLEMAVLKGDSMEWVVEKVTELGVRRLIPVLTDHTVVQTKNKGPHVFRERWQKIADQALKQCGRLERLDVSAPIFFTDLLNVEPPKEAILRLWCDEKKHDQQAHSLVEVAKNLSLLDQDVRLLIGPEGGWSQDERSTLERQKVVPISLGPLIMRAETAALFSVSIISAFMRAR